jgi:signal peptidase II
MRHPLPFLALVSAAIALDQFSKVFVCGRLALHESLPLWRNVFHLTHERNTGVAFSFGRNHPSVIFVLTAALALVLLWLYLRNWRTLRPVLLASLGLVLAGAIGNLLDRLALGYVRDFLDFRPELPLVGHWAVFNPADSMICVGVALFLFAEWRGARPPVPIPATRQEGPGQASGGG